MREKHPAVDADVSAEAPIWRYFDLPKFISLLERNALWFSRSDLLGDPLEGSFTQAREADRQRFIENPPEGQTKEQVRQIFQQNAAVYASLPRCAYVNCWHIGDHESMAMWQGYGGGPYGVAVRSTFGLLDAVLPPSLGIVPMDTIYLTRVKYLDYQSETERVREEGNVFGPFTCKSLAYEHEHELRALLVNMTNSNTPVSSCAPGLFVEVDIAKLIQRVTVSPLSPPWFDELVVAICLKFGHSLNVTRSIVFGQPVF